MPMRRGMAEQNMGKMPMRYATGGPMRRATGSLQAVLARARIPCHDADMEQRFVIQIHRGWGPTHYDLMIEDGSALATWQFADPPIDADGSMRCGRIADHRPAYLTYEGPISGGRGAVSIFDGGRCEVFARGPARWRVRFGGKRLAGTWELHRDEGAGKDGWAMARVADAS